ncbi:unnamed protein product [Didymodactylos carnosus]|uniref:Uncharacterized protein n=1 Tax=Didymodactylos carnosus TaxID=1234261 RepID=A0A8S2HME9_9BILA|nr:unnamed protein product [Didymodactylos carnosus]CAF3640518.1 unnamed protein product [Didymodactylos carnosus]
MYYARRIAVHIFLWLHTDYVSACVRQSTRLKKPLLTPTTTDQNGGDNDEAQEPKRSSSKLPIKDNQATFSDSDGGWEDVKDYPVPSELLLANGSHLLSAKHKNGIEIELNEDEIANGKRRKKKQQQDIDDDIEDVTPKRERSLSAKLTSNVNNDKRKQIIRPYHPIFLREQQEKINDRCCEAYLETDIEDCYVTVDLNTNKINLSEQQEVDFPIIYAFSFHLI